MKFLLRSLLSLDRILYSHDQLKVLLSNLLSLDRILYSHVPLKFLLSSLLSDPLTADGGGEELPAER